MGLLSAGLTAFYVRDASLLSSLPDLPTVPRLPNPRTFVSGSTVFFGVVCLIVILVLAYVTNPSESSFRTFLTEQAFRRHLHKLQDEDAYGDEESLEYDSSHPNNRTRKGKRFGAPRPRQSKPLSKPSMIGVNDSSTTSYVRTPRFHFSNHLGVALQTPSHVFKSYGLCTIAVTQNVDTSSPYICANTNHSQHTNGHPVVGARAQNGHGLSNHPGHYESGGTQKSRIRGTWYIGAFGKWWIGGELTFLKEDLIQSIASTNPATVQEDADKSQADLKSGRYEVKSLDQVDAFSGLPIKSEDLVPVPQSIPSSSPAPKTRSRASTRSFKQTATPLPSRGSTPPPPTRTQVTIATPNGHKPNGHSPTSPKQEFSKKKSKSRSNSNAAQLNVTVQEPSHTPDVVEMMKEITKSQAAVQDLRDQLSSFQQQALASHAALRITLDEHRSRKKQDDATRTDLKSRMKTLEENKRHADTGKRDAEKKLKSAQAARDMAINRMQRLTGEAEAMKKRMENGEERMQKSKEEVAKVEEESNVEMENKRAEIKSLEESIGALGTKAKELEETLVNEKEKLAVLKRELDEKKLLHQQQQQATLALALQMQQQQAEALASGYAGMENVGLGGPIGLGVDQPAQQPTIWTGSLPVQSHTHNINPAILSTSPSAFNLFEHSTPYSVQHPRRPSAEVVPMIDKQQSTSASQSRIRSVSLGELSSMTQAAMAAGREHSANLSPSDEAFSLFGVGDENQVRKDPSYSSLNISTSGLLPSNLVNSIDTESPLSILTPSAAANTRESRWRTGMWPWRSDNLSKSTPPSGSSGGKDFDPFDSKPPSLKSQPGPTEETASLAPKPAVPGPRRWFSRSTTTSMNGPEIVEPPSQVISAPEGVSPSRSRLNPDAKVFSLPKGRNLLSSTMWTLDGMTPMPPPTNVHPGPLHLITPPADNPLSSFSSGSSLPVPTPATGTSSATAPPATKPRFRGLFSSPFAPSPAEREALQRALEKNLSHDRISITSDGSGEGSNLRLPPSPFGLPPPNPSLFDVDEEESDSGWASVLKSKKKKESANNEGKAKEGTK